MVVQIYNSMKYWNLHRKEIKKYNAPGHPIDKTNHYLNALTHSTQKAGKQFYTENKSAFQCTQLMLFAQTNNSMFSCTAWKSILPIPYTETFHTAEQIKNSLLLYKLLLITIKTNQQWNVPIHSARKRRLPLRCTRPFYIKSRGPFH